MNLVDLADPADLEDLVDSVEDVVKQLLRVQGFLTDDFSVMVDKLEDGGDETLDSSLDDDIDSLFES